MSPTVFGQQWQTATQGYTFKFPSDHFEHPDFQSEWWYYTGNLRTADGQRFGYELTFFRQATRVGSNDGESSTWNPTQIYLAHLALSDIGGQQFFNTERLNRSGPGLAGANQHGSRYWNGNWQVRWLHPGVDDECELRAIDADLTLNLNLKPAKPLVLEAPGGLSRKGPLPGEASLYYSFTRINTSGQIRWKGKPYQVTGTSWMDHEFFTEPSDNALQGWDWLSVQLTNGDELMLYRLRRTGTADSYASGTYVNKTGKARYLSSDQIRMTPESEWTSPDTHNRYPVKWQVAVTDLSLKLEVTTPLKNQELRGANSASPTYWEGAIDLNGTLSGSPVNGVGYLEMTGYGKRIQLGTK